MKNNQEHLDWLESKLIEYESQLSAAIATVNQLQPIVIHLKGAIEHFKKIESGDSDSGNLFPAEVAKTSTIQNKQKSSSMPPRRPKYSKGILIDVIKEVVDKSVLPLHANDIVHEIFECRTDEEKRRAKHNIVAELYRGIKLKKGWWKSLGGNQFLATNLASKEGILKAVR